MRGSSQGDAWDDQTTPMDPWNPDTGVEQTRAEDTAVEEPPAEKRPATPMSALWG